MFCPLNMPLFFSFVPPSFLHTKNLCFNHLGYSWALHLSQHQVLEKSSVMLTQLCFRTDLNKC